MNSLLSNLQLLARLPVDILCFCPSVPLPDRFSECLSMPSITLLPTIDRKYTSGKWYDVFETLYYLT